MHTVPGILYRRSLLFCLLIVSTLSLQAADFFALTNLLSYPRTRAISVELPDSRVFIYGDAPATQSIGLWVDLYVPTNQSFTRLTNSLILARSQGSVTLLPDGKVLVAGGTIAVTTTNGGVPFTSTPPTERTEVFDPSPLTSTTAASMSIPRTSHQATLLTNGDVLITGGRTLLGSNSLVATAAVEIYKPALNQLVTVGSMNVARYSHTATLLQDGRVLVVGGSGTSNSVFTAEVYDPQTQSFTLLPSFTTARTLHKATLLNDGRVLISGGQFGATSTALCDVFAPQSNTISHIGNMTVARRQHMATALPNGQVLIAGGSIPTTNGTVVASASTELFDPVANTFTAGENMTSARDSGSAVLLSNGQVLISGGSDSSNTLLRTAEIYDPELYLRMSDLAGLQNQIATLSNSLTACEAEHSQDLLSISSLSNQVYQLTITNVALYAQYTNVLGSNAMLSSSNVALQSQMAGLQFTNAQLTNQVYTLGVSNFYLFNQLTNVQGQNATLTSSNAQLQTALAASQATNALLGNQVAGLQFTNGVLQSQLSDALAANTALSNQVAALASQVSQLQGDLTAAQTANQLLTNQVASLTANLALLQAQINAVGSSVTNLTAYFRSEFSDPGFVIAGTNVQQQVQRLVDGIEAMNHGNATGLYFELK